MQLNLRTCTNIRTLSYANALSMQNTLRATAERVAHLTAKCAVGRAANSRLWGACNVVFCCVMFGHVVLCYVMLCVVLWCVVYVVRDFEESESKGLVRWQITTQSSEEKIRKRVEEGTQYQSDKFRSCRILTS